MEGSIVLIKHNKNWGVDLSNEKVTNLSKKALNYFGYDKSPYELSVVFVGRKKAKKLNQDYRNKDYIPQVLGFPMTLTEKDEDGKIRMGDIVICTEKLKYEAIFQKKSVEKVLEEWLVHGVENLLKG